MNPFFDKQLASKENEKPTWDTFEKPKPVKKTKSSAKIPVGVVLPQTREEKSDEQEKEEEKIEEKLEKEIRPRRKSVISVNENAATIGMVFVIKFPGKNRVVSFQYSDSK